jgi:hypothetical protein
LGSRRVQSLSVSPSKSPIGFETDHGLVWLQY